MRKTHRLAPVLLALAACRSTPESGEPAGAAAQHYVVLRDQSCVVCAVPIVREGERFLLPFLWLELEEGVEVETLRVTRKGPGEAPETLFEAHNRGDRPSVVLEGFSTRLGEGGTLELSVKHTAAATPLHGVLR
jgi:hypothetical protein